MKRVLVLLALVAANVYAWTLSEPRDLTVSFLDVGEGDAVFIQAPGSQVLIDGGPVGSGVLRGIGARVPFFDRSLDAVIETTPTASESGGLIGVFDRYHIANFLTSPVLGDTKTASMLARAAANEGSETGTLARGARILFGGGAYADVLSPNANTPKLDAHSGALILRIVYGRTSFLLSSEAPQKTEQALAAEDGAALKSDVALAGEHGSKNASAPSFVAVASPAYAVLSYGCTNRFGHPATSTLDAFRSVGATLLNTCEDGAVTFQSDGQKVLNVP